MPVAAVLIVGLLALLWLFAVSPILSSISKSLSTLIPPIPGIDWSGISSALQKMWLTVAEGYVTAVKVPIAAVQQTYNSWHAQGQANSTAHGAAFNAIYSIVTAKIPLAITQASGIAIANATAQVTFLRSQLWTVRDQAYAAAAAAQATAEAYAAASVDFLRSQLWTVRDQLTASISAQGAAFDQDLKNISANLWAVRDQALAYTDSLFAQAETDLKTADANLELEFNAGLKNISAEISQDVTTLQGQIAAVAPAVLGLILPALQQVETEVQAIEDSPCQQFCDPLGSLGQALSGLELAALIAFAVEVVRDPRGTGKMVETVVGPLADGALAVTEQAFELVA